MGAETKAAASLVFGALGPAAVEEAFMPMRSVRLIVADMT